MSILMEWPEDMRAGSPHPAPVRSGSPAAIRDPAGSRSPHAHRGDPATPHLHPCRPLAFEHAVRRPDGTFWTPNGNHRLNALRELGAKTVVALLVPEEGVAYQILALNTEKSHNLREKALEVIRMARDLATFDDAPERDHELVFEEPAFLTLGLCYEKNGRFSGGTYQPVLKRLESFLPQKLPKAIQIREGRAAQLAVLDEAVAAAVAGLKARGFESPYLKSFVVARINPIRFRADAEADFDEVTGKMTAAAKKFDAGKVKADQIARSGGPPEAAE